MMAAERQVRRIRYALFRSIMTQEIGWFDQLNSGELSSRLVADLGKEKNLIYIQSSHISFFFFRV